jgi:hypothetical protein
MLTCIYFSGPVPNTIHILSIRSFHPVLICVSASELPTYDVVFQRALLCHELNEHEHESPRHGEPTGHATSSSLLHTHKPRKPIRKYPTYHAAQCSRRPVAIRSAPKHYQYVTTGPASRDDDNNTPDSEFPRREPGCSHTNESWE